MLKLPRTSFEWQHELLIGLKVFYGMQLHTRTFLADSQWRDLPWKPSQKGLRDMLIDILLEMPEIYHRNDELARETDGSKVMSRIINITELCWQLDSQIREWYDQYKTFVAGPMYWPTLSTCDSPIDDAESGKVFPVAFEFPSYDVAQSMVLYWLALLLVHPILCHMYERLNNTVGERQEDMVCTCVDKSKLEAAKTTEVISSLCLRHLTMDQLPSLGYRREWACGAARNICQSAEYFMQERMGKLGPAIFLPRLVVVREFLAFASGDRTRELNWINHLLRKIQDRGNDVTRYI